jgi:hypothetical protein
MQTVKNGKGCYAEPSETFRNSRFTVPSRSRLKNEKNSIISDWK